MLLYVQARINERTGWADWFINAFLIYMTAMMAMAAVLLAVRPEGFRTVGIAALGFVAIAVVASIQGVADDLAELDSGRPSGQLELIKPNRPRWLGLFIRRLRYTIPFMITVSLMIGLPLALAGE